MKKIILSTIIILGFMLCSQSCGKKSSKNETSTDSVQSATTGTGKLIRPQTDLNIENLPDDAIFSASFTADDFNWPSLNLNMTIYEEETFDIADINQLQVGDTILTSGKKLVVNKKEENNDGLLINGGYENDGLTLVADDESNCYRATEADDASVYDEVGNTVLYFAENYTIVDYGDDPQTPTTVKTNQQSYIENLPSNRRGFSMYDTTVEVQGGQITGITRNWRP